MRDESGGRKREGAIASASTPVKDSRKPVVIAFTYLECLNFRFINGVENAEFALVNSIDVKVSFQLLIVTQRPALESIPG
jgi:hypothetical protein